MDESSVFRGVAFRREAIGFPDRGRLRGSQGALLHLFAGACALGVEEADNIRWR